jgi:hypothetical protein
MVVPETKGSEWLKRGEDMANGRGRKPVETLSSSLDDAIDWNMLLSTSLEGTGNRYATTMSAIEELKEANKYKTGVIFGKGSKRKCRNNWRLQMQMCNRSQVIVKKCTCILYRSWWIKPIELP